MKYAIEAGGWPFNCTLSFFPNWPMEASFKTSWNGKIITMEHLERGETNPWIDKNLVRFNWSYYNILLSVYGLNKQEGED